LCWTLTGDARREIGGGDGWCLGARLAVAVDTAPANTGHVAAAVSLGYEHLATECHDLFAVTRQLIVAVILLADDYRFTVVDHIKHALVIVRCDGIKC